MKQTNTRIEKVKDGEVIITEGTWAYYTYVLKDGKAKVLKEVDGKQVLIGTLTRGDIFGEMGFLGQPRRTTSVVADGDVTVEMIAKDTFMNFFNELPLDMQNKLYAIVTDLTIADEIYSRLIVLFQNMQDIEMNMVDGNTFEMEIEGMPEFMRRAVMAITRGHNASVEKLKRLSFQLKEKQVKRLSQNC